MLKKCEKKFEKMMKIDFKVAKNFILPKVWVGVRSATTSNWVCACTLIWTCEVRACDPKNGRNSVILEQCV